MPKLPTGGAEELFKLFALGEVVREREIPWDVEQALRQGAPQAILRDLYRPVSSFNVLPYEFEQVSMVNTQAGVRESRETRETLLASYKVPIVDLVRTAKDMLSEFRKLKETLKQPWTDAPKLAPDAKTKFQAARYFK